MINSNFSFIEVQYSVLFRKHSVFNLSMKENGVIKIIVLANRDEKHKNEAGIVRGSIQQVTKLVLSDSTQTYSAVFKNSGK